LIPEQIRRPEEGRPKEALHDERLLLKDMDISETQSHRWQAIASVPYFPQFHAIKDNKPARATLPLTFL